MSFDQLTRREIQKMADAPIFERGEEYLASGLVEQRQREGDSLTASVRGSRAYRVEISEGPRFRCTCPFEFSGPCKHVVATLLAYIEAPSSFERPDPLYRALRQRNKDELIQMLVELLADRPEAARRFGLLAASR